MKIKTNRTPLLALESVAMTDIVLNMFIFFFISFSLIYTFNPVRAQKIEVQLPKASNIKPFADADLIEVTLTKDGLVYIDQSAVTMKNFSNALKEKAGQNASVSVVIRSDKLVPFKSIVTVLDAVSGLGISRVSIAAIKD